MLLDLVGEGPAATLSPDFTALNFPLSALRCIIVAPSRSTMRTKPFVASAYIPRSASNRG